MSDVMHAPVRRPMQQERAPRSDVPRADDEWTCTIAPNPPGAMLLVRRRGADPARDVRVLVNGKPAKDDPAVYLDAIVPESMSLGAELDFHLALRDARPRLDTVEVRWIDGAGRRRSCLCDVENQLARAGD